MPDGLQWLLDDLEESEGQPDLLRDYYQEIANGPMGSYRSIIQSGAKQGQNYFVHVLDGINILHKLRTGHIIEMNDLEEKLLFCVYTIHDINKIPPYGGRGVLSSYINIATLQNIKAELKRLHIERFWNEYEPYLEDIRKLMLLHQRQAAPLDDLDLTRHTYQLRYERLEELGKLLYAVDNLDLSHTLSLNNHLQIFVAQVNAISERRWRWIIHHLGENRGVLTNIMHNTVVKYVQQRHTHDNQTVAVDLLYRPEGVAYLLPERETFSWGEADTRATARLLAQAITEKQADNVGQFVKASQLGIRVSQAAIESGASYDHILHTIYARVGRKSYQLTWLDVYNQKLQSDLQAAAQHTDQAIALSAQKLLNATDAVVPLNQELLKRGDMALAYRNLLHDHLLKQLKQTKQCDAWTHVYRLLQLPPEKYALYEQIDHYRRHYFIALDYAGDLDTMFELFLSDVLELVGEEHETEVNDQDFYEYLAVNLEFLATEKFRDFKAYLQRYQKDRNKQCCMCSSASATAKLMDPDVPNHMGVQVFSNRLKGGSGEPKRNVCPVCRIQLIMEKITRISFKKGDRKRNKKDDKKGGEKYANFYLHLFPYSFFPAPYLRAIYSSLKAIVHEENQCFFLKRDQYYRRFNDRLEKNLQHHWDMQTQSGTADGVESDFGGQATVVNGISVPPFSEAVSNMPTLPLNAPGDNYTQQFLFALTHALMIADFFGCRVLLSRTPFPPLSGEYMAEHELAFFMDGSPLNLRWLLPANEYRSLETYRDDQAKDGGEAFVERQHHWARETLDPQGYAAIENVSKRLSLLYQIAQALHLGPEDREIFILEAVMAMTDDPFSLYRVVDLTIEQHIRVTPGSESKAKKNSKPNKKGETASGPKLAPEQMAISLSKRVAPLLELIIKE